MPHHAGNQRSAGCLILTNPSPPPFMVHTAPQHLVSQHLGCPINTTRLLVQLKTPPPPCPTVLHYFSTFFRSFAISLHSRRHLNQDARIWACEESRSKCDKNTREKKLRKGRKNGCLGKTIKRWMFGLVDRLLWLSLRASLLCTDVNNVPFGGEWSVYLIKVKGNIERTRKECTWVQGRDYPTKHEEF